MSALTPAQRQRHQALALQLRPLLVEIIELPNGYELRLNSDLDNTVAEFCELESLCCPFFTLIPSSHGGNSKLSVTGEGDIKPFIRSEFGLPEV